MDVYAAHTKNFKNRLAKTSLKCNYSLTIHKIKTTVLLMEFSCSPGVCSYKGENVERL